MLKKTIDIPIYCSKLTIILDNDLSYVEKKYKTKSLKDFGAVTLNEKSKYRNYIVDFGAVTLKEKSKYRNYIVAFEYSTGSIIAHEIVHIINYIYLDCGIKLDRMNDENQAYLTGWLFDEIYNFLNNK